MPELAAELLAIWRESETLRELLGALGELWRLRRRLPWVGWSVARLT